MAGKLCLEHAETNWQGLDSKGFRHRSASWTSFSLAAGFAKVTKVTQSSKRARIKPYARSCISWRIGSPAHLIFVAPINGTF